MNELGSTNDRRDTNDFIKQLLENFIKTTKFSKVSVNNVYSSVEVKFEREIMEIRNLADFYPFLSFKIQRPENNLIGLKISYSQNGEEWYELNDADMTNQLEIFLLYHPLFVLPRTKFEIRDDFIPQTIEGRYSIADLPFHSDVKQFFSENDENSRKVRIVHYDNHLTHMTQKDFPPFNEVVSLEFSGY